MKLKYLGTAAAEGIPNPFCGCETCKKARELGGRELRSRSQALVDGELLVDFCPDTLFHAYRFGLDFTKIRNCIVTHIHEDHFYPGELNNLIPGYAHVSSDVPQFTLYGSKDISSVIGKYASVVKIGFIKPFEKVRIGDFEVTALKAWHGTDNPYNYLISREGKTALYAHDTDIYQDETWDYLKGAGIKVDFASLDCTGGAFEDIAYHHHMCLGRNRIFRDKMKQLGIADKKTIFVLNHFSHNGDKVLYCDMTKISEKEGFLVSYDGMEVEF